MHTIAYTFVLLPSNSMAVQCPAVRLNGAIRGRQEHLRTTPKTNKRSGRRETCERKRGSDAASVGWSIRGDECERDDIVSPTTAGF